MSHAFRMLWLSLACTLAPCLARLENGCQTGQALLQISAQKPRDAIHVAYATTVNNSTGPGDVGFMSSILSMSRALSPLASVIHIIVPSEDRQAADDFVHCLRGQFDSSELLPDIQVHEEIPLPFYVGLNEHTTYLTNNTLTYARWYLPQYLPEVSRVLYIDTDTIVQGSLSDLFEQELEVAMLLKPCGVVCRDESLDVHYPASAGSIPEAVRNETVMNAGVMLANLDLWRKQNVTAQLVDMAESFLAENTTMDDQLILNIVAQQSKSFGFLDEAYNQEGPGYADTCDFQFTNATHIIHWAGPNKFWTSIGVEPRGSCFVDNYLPTKQCHLSTGSLLKEDLPMLFTHVSSTQSGYNFGKLADDAFCVASAGWTCPYTDASTFEIDEVPKILQKLQAVQSRSLEEVARAKQLGEVRTAEVAERRYQAAIEDSIRFSQGSLRLWNPSLAALPRSWKRSSDEHWLAAFRFQTQQFLNGSVNYVPVTDPVTAPSWFSSHIVLAVLNDEMKPVRPVRLIGPYDISNSTFDCQLPEEDYSRYGPEDVRIVRADSEDISIVWSGRKQHHLANVHCDDSKGGQQMYMSRVTSDLRLEHAHDLVGDMGLDAVKKVSLPFFHQPSKCDENLLFLSSANPHVIANVSWVQGLPTVMEKWNTSSQLLSAWMGKHNLEEAHVSVGPVRYQQDGQDVYLSILHGKQPYCDYPGNPSSVPAYLLEYKSVLYTFQASPPFEILSISDKWLPLLPKRSQEGMRVAFPTALMAPSTTAAEELWVLYGQGDCQSQRLILNATELPSYLP